jgi:four helix bundle protein
MQDYHQLEIWNCAMDFTVAVYKFAAGLPQEEKYNLASQLRRAASSVPLNISEGAAQPARQTSAAFSAMLIVP